MEVAAGRGMRCGGADGRGFVGRFLLLAWCTWMSGSLRADTHIYVGSAGLNPGDPLAITVASLFDTNSGYRLPMLLRTNGLNAGYHRGDALTFTALAATDLGTGQLAGRALLGSRLAMQLVSVEGPEGGEVQFWEGDGENPGNQVTFRAPVGLVGGTHAFLISENDGAPGSDPYGHIHGREFTTSVPGLYAVGFRAIDVSTNGPGGGPLHVPSAPMVMYFQAGPTIESIERTGPVTRIRFRSAPGVTNVLEAAARPESGSWIRVAGPLRGNSALQTLSHTNLSAETQIYRLHLLNTPP